MNFMINCKSYDLTILLMEETILLFISIVLYNLA